MVQNASQLHIAAIQTDHRRQPNCARRPSKLISAAKLTSTTSSLITFDDQSSFDFSLRIDSPFKVSLMLL